MAFAPVADEWICDMINNKIKEILRDLNKQEGTEQGRGKGLKLIKSQ